MGRHRNFIIKETLDDLNTYKSQVKDYKSSQQLKALVYIKSEKHKNLTETAKACDVHYSTLQRWIVQYKEQGIEGLLKPEKRNKPSKIIPKEVHVELKEKLGSSENPFSGYVEVQEWLLKEHEIKIEYQWLWKYMKTKLNSVLKVPRKTNVKKDKAAEDSFFKTTR